MALEAEVQLGRKLTECPADKLRIAIQTGWRTIFCILLDISNFGGIAAIRQWGDVPPEMSTVIVNLVLTVIFGLFPLIHLREYLAFYEYGIIYRKRAYLWSYLGQAEWRDHTYGGIFRSILMATNRKVFNVTYVVNAKKQFNRAYMNY
ncbi:MAG: hypothetical protein HFI91_00180 [Lachnospiraceae bacterium]|nr:hypothetical protein [Lachnospiraceae bacterium]